MIKAESRPAPQVVDSCDRDRMGISKQELLSMLDEEELKSAILLVFANKQDMDQAMLWWGKIWDL